VACLECFLEEQEGFEVVAVAETGLEAVERVAEVTPDLVVMDVRMPGMDGLEATGRIKAREGSPVVIIITLEDNAGARAAAKAAGADGFVAKAAGMDDGLRAAIRRAFRREKPR
jgi:DNA-binding NarL/FixJ family response regulator